MSKNKISVVMITLNEEKDLPSALKSVKKLADEIVVVDSGSTDKTVEIAKKFGAKVYEREFDNYANQKNFALSKAKGDWVLALDADEEISPELSQEIRARIKNDKDYYIAYSMPRKNIILGKFIRYSRWQPEFERHSIWLFQKDKGRFVGDVHEKVVLERGEIGRLENSKIHYQYETVAQFMGMMNRYSELEAGQKVKEGNKFSLFRLFFDPLYNFLVRYFYRLGFLDCWRGFVLSYLMAIYYLEVWVKVWEKGRKEIS